VHAMRRHWMGLRNACLAAMDWPARVWLWRSWRAVRALQSVDVGQAATTAERVRAGCLKHGALPGGFWGLRQRPCRPASSGKPAR
jgi:hypothetical protein